MDFAVLRDGVTWEPGAALSPPAARALQRGLLLLGHAPGPIDGVAGPRTWAAWRSCAGDQSEARATFLDRLDRLTGAAADFDSIPGTEAAIRRACVAVGLDHPAQIAYVLATAAWETAGTFAPVREAFYLGAHAATYREGLRYFPYYGRGYVQLTWRTNYAKYTELLGCDLVGDPDRALDPRVALTVLVHGFRCGTFTGQRLDTFLSDTKTDFLGARRCINGIDRAAEIAALARQHLANRPAA